MKQSFGSAGHVRPRRLTAFVFVRLCLIALSPSGRSIGIFRCRCAHERPRRLHGMAWQANKLELTKSALTGCLAENEQSVNLTGAIHLMACMA